MFVRLHSLCVNSTIMTPGTYRVGLEFGAVFIAQSSRCAGDVTFARISDSDKILADLVNKS